MRKTRGWSQSEAAEELGLGTQTVAKLERGETSPSLGTVLAVARVFRVPFSDLLGKEHEDPARAEDLATISALLGRMDATTLAIAREQLKILARNSGR